MVKFINKLTKTPMWVADNRVEEYKAAGHKLAAEVPAVTHEEVEETAAEEKPKPKKPVKKITPKKR